jgi:cell division protein FtsL
MSPVHRAVFTPKLPPRVSKLVQAYKETPWQKQRQWIALFMLGVVSVAMVAGVYLDVTARAAIEGREIQQLEDEIMQNDRTNADLETQLATLLSTSVMQQRANALGFHSLEADQLEYLVVPGYIASKPFQITAPPTDSASVTALPEFTQSLFDWLDQQVHSAALPLTENK